MTNDSKPFRIVAFAANSRGAGKSTAAAVGEALIQASAELARGGTSARVSFAGPVRDALVGVLESLRGADGKPIEQPHKLAWQDAHKNDEVDLICPEVLPFSPPTARPPWAGPAPEGPLPPITIRNLLISLGTFWGRDRVSSGIWLSQTLHELRFHRDMGNTVFIDDLRFPDELMFLRSLGARIIFIQRDDLATEEVITAADCDAVVCSHGSLKDYRVPIGVTYSCGDLNDYRVAVGRAIVEVLTLPPDPPSPAALTSDGD